MPESINILHAIACDDIRQENTGKFILIGVYAGNIGLPVFPAQMVLGFWMLARPTLRGDYHVQFRLRGPNDIDSWSGQMIVHVNAEEDTALIIPPLPVQIQSAGEILLQYRESGEDWITVSRFDARLVPFPAPPA